MAHGKKNHGKSNPREHGRTGKKICNGPKSKSVKSRHGKKVNVRRRSHRGL